MSSSKLAGRTIALIGLPRELLLDATAALEKAGAEWQAFSATASAPPDAALVITTAGSDVSRFKSPVLLVGAIDAVASAEHSDDTDFIVAPPLDGDELVLRASQLLAGRRERSKRPAVATPVVVAADDDPTTLAIVRAVVTQNAMTCHTASDGKTAVELVRRHRPAVVVLDVNMPFLDGFEVLSAIRNDPDAGTTPVVMLTSVQQESDVVRAFSLGADDYVVKPFNPMELLARLKRIVRKAP